MCTNAGQNRCPPAHLNIALSTTASEKKSPCVVRGRSFPFHRAIHCKSKIRRHRHARLACVLAVLLSISEFAEAALSLILGQSRSSRQYDRSLVCIPGIHMRRRVSSQYPPLAGANGTLLWCIGLDPTQNSAKTGRDWWSTQRTTLYVTHDEHKRLLQATSENAGDEGLFQDAWGRCTQECDAAQNYLPSVWSDDVTHRPRLSPTSGPDVRHLPIGRR